MKSGVGGGERVKGTLPIASGDRFKRRRDRPEPPTKRRGGRRGESKSKSPLFMKRDKASVEKTASQPSQPEDKKRESAEESARETTGSKVSVYV
jgi:hypothetical protein